MVNWRARHEGEMHFNPYYAITELQLTGIAVNFATGLFGCGLWTTYVPIPFYNEVSVSVRSVVLTSIVIAASVTVTGEYIAVRFGIS